MVKISNASYENEIHRVDSPFSEDSKNIFFGQGGPNFGEGPPYIGKRDVPFLEGTSSTGK